MGHTTKRLGGRPWIPTLAGTSERLGVPLGRVLEPALDDGKVAEPGRERRRVHGPHAQRHDRLIGGSRGHDGLVVVPIGLGYFAQPERRDRGAAAISLGFETSHAMPT